MEHDTSNEIRTLLSNGRYLAAGRLLAACTALVSYAELREQVLSQLEDRVLSHPSRALVQVLGALESPMVDVARSVHEHYAQMARCHRPDCTSTAAYMLDARKRRRLMAEAQESAETREQRVANIIARFRTTPSYKRLSARKIRTAIMRFWPRPLHCGHVPSRGVSYHVRQNGSGPWTCVSYTPRELRRHLMLHGYVDPDHGTPLNATQRSAVRRQLDVSAVDCGEPLSQYKEVLLYGDEWTEDGRIIAAEDDVHDWLDAFGTRVPIVEVSTSQRSVFVMLDLTRHVDRGCVSVHPEVLRRLSPLDVGQVNIRAVTLPQATDVTFANGHGATAEELADAVNANDNRVLQIGQTFHVHGQPVRVVDVKPLPASALNDFLSTVNYVCEHGTGCSASPHP